MEIVGIIEIIATVLILISVALVSIPKRFGLYIMIIGLKDWCKENNFNYSTIKYHVDNNIYNGYYIKKLF